MRSIKVILGRCTYKAIFISFHLSGMLLQSLFTACWTCSLPIQFIAGGCSSYYKVPLCPSSIFSFCSLALRFRFTEGPFIRNESVGEALLLCVEKRGLTVQDFEFDINTTGSATGKGIVCVCVCVCVSVCACVRV